MHDPMTVAHDIRYPWPWSKSGSGYRENLLTIWHVDPECDGSDDSCGWFMRSRHCDQEKLKKIESQFTFEWTHGVPNGWFADNGEPNYSCQAITLGMFRIAANIHFGHWSRRADRFLNRNLHNILHFAENNCDSLFTFIVQPYGRDNRETAEVRAQAAASIVYSWLCRADRPWWKYKAKFPNLTLAGWIEQLGSCGRKYLAAESGELNLPIAEDAEDPRNCDKYRALFTEDHRLKDQSDLTLRQKILACLFIGGCVHGFGLAKTATDTIMGHIADARSQEPDIRYVSGYDVSTGSPTNG